MFKYITKRVLMAIITLWAIITITFMLMNLAPGNPFSKEGKMPPAVMENLMEKYGLNKPKSEQYVMYLKNIARGDFGDSMISKTETVNEMISRGFPVSARLGLQAFLIAVVFGILFGTLAAIYQNQFADHFFMIIAIIGISVPSFIMGSLLIQYVAKPIKFFPIGGWGSFKHTLLPSFTLALMPMASISRLMRSSMLEVLNQDYVKTAKSKGLKKSTTIIRHGIRNAILPIISSLGTTLSGLLTGSFVVEKIFGIPGLGMFFTNSIFKRDYTLIMGTTVFYSLVLITLLLIVDILYVVVDPRIDVTKEGE